MLTDIEKHKHLGRLDDILFVLQDVLSEEPKTLTGIKKYCSGKSVDLIYAFDGILALLEFTELASREGSSIRLSQDTSRNQRNKIDKSQLAKVISEKIFAKLRQELLLGEFISFEKIKFDVTLNRISILSNSIPLKYSSLKNLLIDLGAFSFSPITPMTLIVDRAFEDFFEENVVAWIVEENEKKLSSDRRAISLDELINLQKLKDKYGAEAEKFVVGFEKIRLKNHPARNLVRRISQFDVNAGYDIASFESQDSKEFDRFVEVKSFSNFPKFYWSKNELAVAELKRTKYYLYLVDRSNMNNIDYQPVIIQDPYARIFHNDDWRKDPQNWLITPSF